MNTELSRQWNEYLQACEAGDDSLAEEILRQAVPLLGTNSVVLDSEGALSNFYSILTSRDRVDFGCSMLGGAPDRTHNVSVVNGRRYLREAIGTVLAGPLSGQQPMTEEVSSSLYVFSETSFAEAIVDGVSVQAQLSGSIRLAPQSEGNGDHVWLPIDARYSVATSLGTWSAVLDKSCPYNTVQLGPDNTGRIALRLVATSSDELIGRYLDLDGYWVEIPISYLPVENRIVMIGEQSGTQVFPTTPNPIADFNKDGQVNDGDFAQFSSEFALGHAAADVDGDGFVTAQDASAFIDRWEYWSVHQ